MSKSDLSSHYGAWLLACLFENRNFNFNYWHQMADKTDKILISTIDTRVGLVSNIDTFFG